MAPDARPGRGVEAFPAELKLIGTEPFWSLVVDRETVRWSEPEIFPENARGTGTRLVEGSVLVITGRIDGSAFTARISRGTCSDGMSDTVYDYAAELSYRDRDLRGCASDITGDRDGGD